MKRGSKLSDEMRARMRRYEGGHKYEIALKCGISPSTFSAWARAIYSPAFADKRALQLGHLLGLHPDQVFAPKDDVADDDGRAGDAR